MKLIVLGTAAFATLVMGSTPSFAASSTKYYSRQRLPNMTVAASSATPTTPETPAKPTTATCNAVTINQSVSGSTFASSALRSAANQAAMLTDAKSYCEGFPAYGCRARVQSFGPPFTYYVDYITSNDAKIVSAGGGSGGALCTAK